MQLNKVQMRTGKTMEQTVREYDIRVGSKRRHIIEPLGEFKSYLRALQKELQRVLPVHHRAIAWVPGRNAELVGRDIARHNSVLEIDIKSYFDTIHPVLLLSRLSKYIGYKRASKIVKITTYRGKFPQGFPTSPVLANVFRYELDQQLYELASGLGLEYYAYGDNLIFAGDYIPYELKSIVFGMLQSYLLTPNYKKSQLKTKSKSQKVLGMVCNIKPNIPHRYYENVYEHVKQSLENGYIISSPSLVGKLKYIQRLNPSKAYHITKHIGSKLTQIQFD